MHFKNGGLLNGFSELYPNLSPSKRMHSLAGPELAESDPEKNQQ
jgi:hypothetical protein